MTSPSTEKSSDTGLAAQATKLVVSTVESVRGKTTGPLLFAARLLIYSVVFFVTVVAGVSLLMIATVRIVNQLLPGDVWTTYLLLGGFFALLGMFLWSKRSS
ncbi:MAG: hypothetical protein QF637_12305 [Acidimicrobiales bacterium]|nr:hypothetical protein [Acidimicrobiales bacterium]